MLGVSNDNAYLPYKSKHQNEMFDMKRYEVYLSNYEAFKMRNLHQETIDIPNIQVVDEEMPALEHSKTPLEITNVKTKAQSVIQQNIISPSPKHRGGSNLPEPYEYLKNFYEHKATTSSNNLPAQTFIENPDLAKYEQLLAQDSCLQNVISLKQVNSKQTVVKVAFPINSI